MAATEISPGDRWFTVGEVAAQLTMSTDYVRDRIADGSLPAKRIHESGRGEYRVSDPAIAEFMASRPDAVPPADAPR